MNLDKELSLVINRPKADSMPLYTRVDGAYEEKKSDKWIGVAENTFNSPNNIRRLFITGDKIWIQYFKPPMKSGRPDTRGNWIEVSWGNSLFEVIKGNLGYEETVRRYTMERAINPSVQMPEKERITGWGLKVFSSPWVISNIEEIYFDCSILSSEDVQGAVNGASSVFQAWIGGKSGIINSKLPLELFGIANNVNEEDLSKRYPRLKTVAIISKLKEAFEMGLNKDIKEDIWIQNVRNKEVIKQLGGLLVLGATPIAGSGFNSNFHCRDGIYKFDREVLLRFVEEYRDKGRISKETNVDNDSVRLDKSEFESMLDILLSSHGEDFVLKAMALGFKSSTKEEVERVFIEMSTEGEATFRKIMSKGMR